MSARFVLLALSLALLACRPESRSPENLVLIVVDTLREDRVHAFGYPRPQTPFLDGLAQRGIRASAKAPSSWTRPSTATILTGLHPLEHQVISPSDLVPESAQLLPESFAAAGFSTTALIANSVVSRKWGFGRGYGVFVDLQQELGRVPDADEMNERIAPLLEELAPPFYLYVHYMDPHLPYDPGVGWDGGPLPAELAAHAPVREEFFTGDSGLEVEKRRTVASDLYDGEVRRADDGVRELLGHLERRGLLERTLVVVTSDHGEELLDHGGFGHGHTLFEEVLRVPLIFFGPGVAATGADLGSFPLEDLAPTLRALFGLERSEPAGRVGRDRSLELRRGRAESGERELLGHLDFVEGAGLSLTSGREKLVLGTAPYRKAWFDLAEDPLESRNLFDSGERPEALLRLASRLASLYNTLARGALERSSTADPENIAQLRALGYLGAASKPRHDRRFPRRIAPADALPGGLRGWESATPAAPCADFGDGGSAQALGGWAGPGNVLERRATAFVLRPSGESARLFVRGELRAAEASAIVLRVEGEVVARERIAPGSFDIAKPFSLRRAAGPLVVGLELEPGPGPANSPARKRDLVVAAICAEGR